MGKNEEQSGYLSALKCLNMQEYPDKNFLLEQAMSQQNMCESQFIQIRALSNLD